MGCPRTTRSLTAGHFGERRDCNGEVLSQLARGKTKVAAEHGAIGCLIYSDRRTMDTRATTYSGGADAQSGWCAARERHGFCVFESGGSLDAWVGATPDAKRLSLKEAKSITKIPVLPILMVTRSLCWPHWQGRWRRTDGAGRFRFRITWAGAAQVHLKVAFNWTSSQSTM